MSIYLTARRRLVTVVELERDPPPAGVRPLVLAAQAHAGWRGARSWLGLGTRVLPCLEYVPDLRDTLDATLRDAIARMEQRIRDAGWARDDP